MPARIVKPVKGSLRVRVPYNANNRSAWKDLGLRPVWVKEGNYWRLSRDKFSLVVRAVANGLGRVEVTVHGHTNQQCDTRCWNAEGDDCVCSCAGQNHGNYQYGWLHVGETTVVKTEYVSKTYIVESASSGPIFSPSSGT